MPAGTLGFRAADEIERQDYDEVLVPELRRVIEAGGKLRTLYLIEDVDEIEPGALWADTKLGFDLGVRHHEAWVRSAVVTDIGWMARRDEDVRVADPGRGARVPTGAARGREDLSRRRHHVAGAVRCAARSRRIGCRG